MGLWLDITKTNNDKYILEFSYPFTEKEILHEFRWLEQEICVDRFDNIVNTITQFMKESGDAYISIVRTNLDNKTKDKIISELKQRNLYLEPIIYYQSNSPKDLIYQILSLDKMLLHYLCINRYDFDHINVILCKANKGMKDDLVIAQSVKKTLNDALVDVLMQIEKEVE